MSERPELTPCLICEKAVIYEWPEHKEADNLDGACHVVINGGYGSVFDLATYGAIICDDCLDKAIQSCRVSLIHQTDI